jgi:demethylmenaquinone methyltransferase/2-methoxy-6-polyprenyl-1,4-benzoquinol methylase
MDNIRKALTDQITYYQLRAGEYDQWWYRQGRYDRGPAANTTWFNEADQIRAALEQASFTGHILELAPGTGIWTKILISEATTLTAIDASSEMISINKNRVKSPRVSYLVANLFNWEPDQHYDAVFFGFWLSHVPREKLPAFLQQVSRSLRTEGKVFFVDGLRTHSSTAVDHQLPPENTQILTRKLDDGQAFDIVKVFYEADELIEACNQAGLLINIYQTPTYFYYGSGYKL